MLRPTPTATIAGSSGPRSWWLSPPPPPPPPTPYEGAASMGALPELPALENPPPLPQAVAAHHPPTTGRSGKTKPMLLSEECQKRGFNPRFHGWIDSQGKTHCSVEVKGVVYKAPRGFNTLPEAKNVAAKRALPVVRKMPMRGARPVATAVEPSDQSRTTTSSAGPTRVKQELRVSRHERSGFSGYRGYKRARVPVKSEPGAGRSPALGDRAERYPRRATHRDGIYLRIKTRVVQDGIAYSQTGNDYDRDRDRDAELHSLIRRVHSLYGSSKGPSTRIMEDSLASRAFLEGMALGTQLGEPARHERRGSDRYRERSRSASPAWSRRRPRSRSPQRSRRIISYRD
ncbi:hypothetical protein GGS26DRAFT_187793 [Hypomontagnella submonticulosa]|nr:hypothetical protein GGS26DRAFT_187793 [Hypomontagnella submonticulosa]